MRLAVLALACAAAGAASAQPTAVPTPAGAGAVAPSDQSAVKPSLPDERANATLSLGGPPPTPAPLPAPVASASAPPAPAGVQEPGRSEPDTGSTSAATGSGHKKAGVVRPVSVTKAAAYTVVSVEAGKSVTLRRPEGTLVTFPLARKAEVPKDLAPGRSVTIRTRTEGGKKVVTRVREAGDTPVLTNVN